MTTQRPKLHIQNVLIDSMVEEIIDDIVTERLSNIHNTLGPSASEY